MLEPVNLTFRLSVLAEIVLLNAANEPDQVDDSLPGTASQDNHAGMDHDHASYRIIVRVMGFSCRNLHFHALFSFNHAGMSNFLPCSRSPQFHSKKKRPPPRRQAFTLLFLFFFKEITADDEIRYLLCT